MLYKTVVSRKDEKLVEDARAKARKKVERVSLTDLKGHVICHLDQISLNNDLRNLAIMSRSNHARLQSLLRHHKVPEGKASKQFAFTLRSAGIIEMEHPVRKMRGPKHVKIQGFNI